MPERTSPPISAVRVQNFRNILDSGKVDLRNIISLIGQNESGKTAFIDAISKLCTTEGTAPTDLCSFREETTHSEIPIITAYIDVEDAAKDLYDQHSGKRLGKKTREEIAITRYADDSYELSATKPIRKIFNIYSSALDITVEKAERAKSELDDMYSDKNSSQKTQTKNSLVQITKDPKQWLNYRCMTRVLEGINDFIGAFSESDETTEKYEQYIDEFRELRELIIGVFSPALPDITKHYDYDLISDTARLSQIRNGDHRTFRNLLSIGGISLNDIGDWSDRRFHDVLDDISDEVASGINNLWMQKNIQIEVIPDNGKLSIYIRDHSPDPNTNPRRRPPSERSDGFRWFLSFYINMYAETRVGPAESKLFLLDEPAIHLHPRGKKNWLSTIEELSDSVQIIYTSHSPYLIHKNHPSRIRAIEVEDDNEEATITSEIFSSQGDTFEPLRNNLGIGLGDSPFVSKRQIVVEGPADYYILTGVAVYDREVLGRNILDWEEISVTPAGGASKVPDKAVWYSSEDISYAMLLDSDDEGQDVRAVIENEYHTLEDGLRRTVMLSTDAHDQDITIEDLFSPNLYVDCFNEVYGSRYDEFDAVGVSEVEGGHEIGEEFYDGTLIVDVLETVIEEQGIQEQKLSKVDIANELKQRLDQGEVKEEDVNEFFELLGELRSATDIRG